MSLDDFLATRPDRCPHGAHIPTQGCPACTPTAPARRGKPAGVVGQDEWSLFVAAVREVVRSDGTVHQGDMRRLIRGRVAPKHIGSLYRRARAEGLLVDTGELEQSTDIAGRNSDKVSRIYRVAA